MPEQAAWGLDIGQTALHAVKLERGKGGSVILTDTFFRSLDTQLDDPAYEDKVLEALIEFKAEKKVGSQPVVVALPGYTTLFRHFPLPAVGGGRLKEIVSYEAKQLIPWNLDEVEWDYQQLRVDEDTGEIEIALVCCRSDIVIERLGMLDEVGINVEALQVGPVAMVNYLLFDQPPEGVSLILDAGSRSTDFIIMNEGTFWLRSIGVSGSDLTRTLMNKFSISFEESEQMKSELGESAQSERVLKVIHPTLRNLCGEVQRSLGYYKSLFRGVDLDEIILAGNTFLLEGSDQFVADNLGYGARSMGVPDTIQLSPGIPEEMLAEHRQVLGIATGLALQGIGYSRYEINLLPEKRQFQKLFKKKEKFGWIAVALVAVAVLISFVTTRSKKPLYVPMMKDIAAVSKDVKKRTAEYAEKDKVFEPEEIRVEAMKDAPVGRGWLLEASDTVMGIVDDINTSRFQRERNVAAKPHFKANWRNNPVSLEIFRTELETAKQVWKVEELEDEETKKLMIENLERQAELRTRYLHDRLGQVFADQAEYAIVKVRKSKDEAGAVTWEIIDQPVIESGKSGSSGKYKKPTSSTQPEMEGGVAVEDIYMVHVQLRGYVVTTDINDVNALRSRLKDPRISNVRFTLRQDVPKNSVLLNKWTDPTPIEVTRDDLAPGEGEGRERNRVVELEEVSIENVMHYNTDFLFAPTVEARVKPEANEELKKVLGAELTNAPTETP